MFFCICLSKHLLYVKVKVRYVAGAFFQSISWKAAILTTGQLSKKECMCVCVYVCMYSFKLFNVIKLYLDLDEDLIFLLNNFSEALFSYFYLMNPVNKRTLAPFN